MQTHSHTHNSPFMSTEHLQMAETTTFENNKVTVSVPVAMKTHRIRTDITYIIFVFIFLVGFGFVYG